jgi:hypothetical protein
LHIVAVRGRRANGLRLRTCPTGCGAGAGVDSAWEQKKLEARKILENAAESHTSGIIILVFVQDALLGAVSFMVKILDNETIT